MHAPSLSQNQRYPVIDHYLINQAQASGQQGLFRLVTALFYNAAAYEQSTWSPNRCLHQERAYLHVYAVLPVPGTCELWGAGRYQRPSRDQAPARLRHLWECMCAMMGV